MNLAGTCINQTVSNLGKLSGLVPVLTSLIYPEDYAGLNSDVVVTESDTGTSENTCYLTAHGHAML